MSYTVAIIGAGPAGLFAAEHLAGQGFAVTLYDQMPNPARKFLLAGRGGLNLTHSEPLEEFLPRYNEAAAWLTPYIHAFTPADLRAWCEELGIETFVGSSGRVFPKSMKAVPLLRAWLKRLAALGVAYHPRQRWAGWAGDALLIQSPNNETLTVTPDATLFALGGASWPRLGSDAAWVPLFMDAGVELAPLQPANCGFTVAWSEAFSSRFAGTPLKSIRLTHGGNTSRGEAMLTATGIEGGAVYALSASIRSAIQAQGETTLYIDLRPQMTVEALAAKLTRANDKKSFSTFLKSKGFAPEAIHLLREASAPLNPTEWSPEELAETLKHLPLKLTGIAGIERAISSAGGVCRHALTPDLMLNAKEGAFVAGEMLDWEAPTGGYLLQACFSTGLAAAKGIARYCAEKGNKPAG